MASGDLAAPCQQISEDSGIALTFDDHSIVEWHALLPLFGPYGARATFYVSHLELIPAQQNRLIQQLHDGGNEIGVHGFRHLSASETLTQFGAAGFVGREVRPVIDLLQGLGLPFTRK